MLNIASVIINDFVLIMFLPAGLMLIMAETMDSGGSTPDPHCLRPRRGGDGAGSPRN